MTSQTVKNLIQKYSDVFNETKLLRVQLRATEYSLENLKSTIQLFDSSFQIAGAKIEKIRIDQTPQTDRNRRATEILRLENMPMNCRDMAK